MIKSTRGLMIAATAASLLLAGCATQGTPDNTGATTMQPAPVTTGNAGCKGMSSCKGNGTCKAMHRHHRRHHHRAVQSTTTTDGTATGGTSSTTTTSTTVSTGQ